MNLVAAPDVSIVGARIPCRTTEWANAVAMYICSGEVPYSEAESWYINTLASARALQPSWQFQINSPNADHFVDAGPPDCLVPATEGPYIGQCPLHFQITRQGNGMAKAYLWMSSLSSPYLQNAPPTAPSRADPPRIPASCDDLCQGLKRAFEARLNDFTEISAAKTNGGGTSGVTLKLDGAGECNVDSVTKPHSTERGAQYACYWPENSSSAANTQFQNLVSGFQVLTPRTGPRAKMISTTDSREPKSRNGAPSLRAATSKSAWTSWDNPLDSTSLHGTTCLRTNDLPKCAPAMIRSKVASR